MQGSLRNNNCHNKVRWLVGIAMIASVASFSLPIPTTTATTSSSQGALLFSIPSPSSGWNRNTKRHNTKYNQNSNSNHHPQRSTTRLRMVATATGIEKDMPEVGNNGIYTVQNETQHKALLEAHKDKLVIMKVFAPWCRACKGLEPKFNAIVRDKKYKDLPIVWADLTIQHNKDYIKSIGVLALPTIQFYAHGQITDTFPCGPSKVPILKRKLVQFINQNVDAETLTLRPPNAVEEEGYTNNVLDVPVDPSTTTTTTTSTDPAVAGAVLPTTNDNTVTESGKGASVAADKTTTQPQEETVHKLVERNKSKIRAFPYFSAMLESEFEGVLSKASLLTFEGGSIIMKEGNSGRTFYVIVQGEVEICQKTSFEDPLTTPPTYLGTVINRFEQGEYFGERALITGEPRAASIRAAVRTKCLAFDRDDFPPTSVLSGKVGTGKEEKELDVINDKYGVTLNDIAGIQQRQYMEAVVANQVRGSWNTPGVIDGVDNDRETQTQPPPQDITTEESDVFPATPAGAETIVPLLIRFKLIRLVTRCFDYIVANRPRFGEEGARRRRNMLVNLLSSPQQVEFTDAYNLIDIDGDGEITVIELRRLMDSIGEEKSDEELVDLIETSHQAVDGKQVITYEDFMGLMAEVEFYHLFLETFRALDKRDSGYVRAKDLDRVLCGVRDLISDDRRSLIDTDDDEMMVDYEQFSRMLLGTALK